MEKPRIEDPSMLIPIEMYQISGHDEVDPEKYLRNKDQDNLIELAVEKGKILDKTLDAPKQELTTLIKQALLEGNPEVKRKATTMICHAPRQERASLIKQALLEENFEIKKEAVKMILYAPEQERTALIKQALSDGNLEIKREAAGAIECAPKQEQDSLRLLVLEKIKQALSEKDPEVWRRAATMIWHAPKQEQDSLRLFVLEKNKQALSEKDPEVWRRAATMIWHASGQEQDSLRLLVLEKIKQALSEKDPEVQIKAAAIIWCAVEQEQTSLIKQALSKKDIKVQGEAAKMIEYAPKHEQDSLRLLVLGKIKQALSGGDPEVKRKATTMICHAPRQERASLIKQAFDAGLGGEIVKPPLYEDSNLNKERFKRAEFEKTGSETTLIGGILKDKLIIRHIEPKAFLAWQKIYENHQVWKNNGFDYVPIEPIQSYRLNKKGLVDVFSGVLDLSLAKWKEVSGEMFMSELQEQRDKIISVLESQGVSHGHTHNNNFVLRFFRDKNGNPNITKIPRLYAIDFDEAVSPSKL